MQHLFLIAEKSTDLSTRYLQMRLLTNFLLLFSEHVVQRTF